MKNQTFIYQDELNDDFIENKNKEYIVDEKYKYINKNIIYLFLKFIIYSCIMKFIAFMYMKIKFHHKVVNKKAFKKSKGNGYFVYGNHTLFGGDAFIPNIVNYSKDVKVIVAPSNISLPQTRWLIKMCGALPTPSNFKASKNFYKAIEYYIQKRNVIQIYPEAHVWPYCTFIRNFKSVSFNYPISLNAPSYALTNTFQKRKFSKTPKVVTYIDGPFYPNESLDKKEKVEDLRNRIYEAMKERSKNSSYQINNYIKEAQ